ncbi:MAG: hypothetical protein JXR77_03945 [Lentisphaeria bacterium]|nr:hypothetical protein [Lentisphaeria bacterium]
MRHRGAHLLLGFLVLSAAHAAEDVWRLGAGVVYRHFGDVEFRSFRFRNHDTIYSEGGPFGIQGYSVLPGLADGSGVTADRVRFRGGEDDVDSEWAPVVSIERDVWTSGDFTLSILGALSYYTLDAEFGACGSAGNPGRFDASHFNYLVAESQVLAPPINNQPLPGFSPGTSASIRISDFELDMLVLDIGVRGRFHLDPFYLTGSLGPSFYWAEVESRVTESGSWNAIPGTGDTGGYTRSRRDSGSDTAVGAFVSLGAGWRVVDWLALEVEMRLDEVAGSIGTDHARLDPDGYSGVFKAVFGF